MYDETRLNSFLNDLEHLKYKNSIHSFIAITKLACYFLAVLGLNIDMNFPFIKYLTR